MVKKVLIFMKNYKITYRIIIIIYIFLSISISKKSLYSEETPEIGTSFLQIGVDDIDPANELDKYFINIGKGKHTLKYSIGFNTLESTNIPGGILFIKYNYRTNYTEYDVKLNTYGIINTTDVYDSTTEDKIKYHLKFQLKRSSKYFDFPFLYDWSMYSFITDADQNLTLRGIFQTGFGSKIFKIPGRKKSLNLFYEIGIVYDYADLEAYTQHLSVFYFKNSILFSWRWLPISGRYYLHYLHEIYKQQDKEETLNQSRLEMEGYLTYHFNKIFDLSFGYEYTKFMKMSELTDTIEKLKLTEQSATYYLIANFRH